MAAYGAGAFVVLQLADIVVPAVGLADSALAPVLALVVIGFPLAIALAWAFDWTSEGVRKTEAAAPAELGQILSAPAWKRWPSGVLALLGTAAVLLVGFAISGRFWLGGQDVVESAPEDVVDATVPTDPYRVLVLPFAVASGDEELERLGHDLVITLAATLDGLGDLRSIDGTTVAARTAAWGSDAIADSGRTLAGQLGAGRVLRGSLLRTGGPGDAESKIRADLAVFETGVRAAETRVTATASAGDIGALTDSITLALLRRLWPSERRPSVEPHTLTTRSIPALRAFLDGELATAQGRWRDAPAHFERAFAIDSTFWLAGARYLDAMAYRSRPVDPELRDLIWERRDELPERERELMEAGRADSLSQRLAQASAVAERHPDSWRAWFGYADQLIHNGMFLGETQDEARSAIERAVALNPTSSTLWQHLFWMALADRDTAVTRQAIEELAELGADSASIAATGLDRLRFDRYLHKLAVSGDRPAAAAIDSLAQQIVGYEGPLNLEQIGGEALVYGFPRGETALEEHLLSLPIPASARRGALRSIAQALAGRGAWDSALVVLEEYVPLADGPGPLQVAYRLAAIGRWLGALDDRAGTEWREALARQEGGLDLAARAEIAWLDGVAASPDAGSAGPGEAGARLRSLADSVPPGSVDSVTVSLLSRSLEALSLGADGRTDAAADAMLALERERAESAWFRRTGDLHPYLTAVNRLAAADWLLENDRPGEAAALLRWHESVQFPAWRAARADATLRGLIRLHRARVADALGREGAAREQRVRALEELDLSTGTLQARVDSARAALGL
jgi:tetratricopeptide (TPR) repeat protein/TolB-like protein